MWNALNSVTEKDDDPTLATSMWHDFNDAFNKEEER